MKKYFVLYKATPEQFKKWMSMPEGEGKKWMEAFNAWMAPHKEAFVDEGGPLNKVKKVTKGNVEDVSNDIGAYAVVQAESLEAAAEMFKDSPHFEGDSWIEVMEMPGWKKE
jgi:hypothetical protein